MSPLVKKAAASIATFTLTVGVLCLASLATRTSLRAQPPDWPLTQNNPNTKCAATGASCSTCGVGVVFGCTSAIPAQWSIGTCGPFPAAICTISTFDCGPQYRCTTGVPTGTACPTPTICK